MLRNLPTPFHNELSSVAKQQAVLLDTGTVFSLLGHLVQRKKEEEIFQTQ